MQMASLSLCAVFLIGCSVDEGAQKVDCPTTVSPEIGVGVSVGGGTTQTHAGLGLNIEMKKANSLEECEEARGTTTVGVTLSN